MISRLRWGTNFSDSRSQLGSTDVGTTMRFGPSCPWLTICWMNDRVWMVLPRPISSARMPPNPYSLRKFRYETPCSW